MNADDNQRPTSATDSGADPTPAPATTPDPMPVAPQPPAEGDCCHSGCTFCVEDMYQNELDRYREALQAWRERHAQA